jgi:hypothetical protein
MKGSRSPQSSRGQPAVPGQTCGRSWKVLRDPLGSIRVGRVACCHRRLVGAEAPRYRLAVGRRQPQEARRPRGP